jgi:hypothetical protein
MSEMPLSSRLFQLVAACLSISISCRTPPANPPPPNVIGDFQLNFEHDPMLCANEWGLYGQEEVVNEFHFKSFQVEQSIREIIFEVRQGGGVPCQETLDGGPLTIEEFDNYG